ncbi:MAG: hypothetical protein SGI72_02845 [Planctomycetota bacterium]|nr:hypothetical protein [Planctomycetota bacterium]
MDLSNYWQENKRFLVTVACGVIVFAILWMLVDRYFGDDLRRQRSLVTTTTSKLAKDSMYSAVDLVEAEKENASLTSAVDTLSKASAFAPRTQFVLDARRGSPSSQYFAAVAAVRENLLRQAGRANMRVPEDLGLPALSPTREPDIARYLEALDLVDRAVRSALATGCDRIDKIEIRLDPRLYSREGVGRIEKTRVSFTLSGAGAPMANFLTLTQAAGEKDSNGEPLVGPLLIEKADMVPARTGAEATLDVTFACARIAAARERPDQ